MHIGKRPFSNHQGPRSISVDLKRLIVPSVLLMGLAFYSWYRLGANPQDQVPPRATESAEFELQRGAGNRRSSQDLPNDLSRRDRAPSRLIVEDLPPLPTIDSAKDYHNNPEETETLLHAVVDGDAALDVDRRLQIVGEGLLTERLAVTELFHRVRSGSDVETLEKMPEFPSDDHQKVSDLSRELRGKRFTFPADVVGDPYPEGLSENRSGVLTYWNLFAQDRITGRLHRVMFFTEEETSPYRNGDSVTITADYLRIFAYFNALNKPVRIPQWVAADVVKDPPPVVTAWTPVFWVSAIAIGGLAILAVSMVLQNRRGSFEQRRRLARESGLSSEASQS